MFNIMSRLMYVIDVTNERLEMQIWLYDLSLNQYEYWNKLDTAGITR